MRSVATVGIMKGYMRRSGRNVRGHVEHDSLVGVKVCGDWRPAELRPRMEQKDFCTKESFHNQQNHIRINYTNLNRRITLII